MKVSAFTLTEITVYLSLFILIVISIYPLIDNVVAYIDSWQKSQAIQSDFRKIAAELQKKSLEAKSSGLLSISNGLYFFLRGSTTSYYASSNAIYRETATETVNLLSADVIATWTVREIDNIFLINFEFQDKGRSLIFKATNTVSKTLP